MSKALCIRLMFVEIRIQNLSFKWAHPLRVYFGDNDGAESTVFTRNTSWHYKLFRIFPFF